MSDATLAALERAIQEHTKDEGNGDLTAAWVLVTGAVGMGEGAGDTVWYETPDSQPSYVTAGLMEGAQILNRAQVYAAAVAGELGA